MKLLSRTILVAAFVCTSSAVLAADAAKKNILLLAGQQSHGPGEHEHNAGVLLLKKCLDESGLPVITTAKLSAAWPSAEELAKADTILFYSDGGGGHFLLKDDRLAQVEKEMKRGAGFVALHYAVEFPADKGGPQALDWMGGFFEANWSVNPHWTANYKELPKHPISNGVKPFSTNDEWYFHMRFAGAEKGKLIDVLADVPPDSTMARSNGPHSGNPAVREAVAAKKPQTTAWAFERANGGRGFGFTGGHFHKGWGQDDQRKLVLNAILWTAKAEVPAEGVPSKVTAEDLAKNLDPKGAPKPKPAPAAANPTAKPLFESAVIHEGAVPVKADLKGAKELFLVVGDAGDGLEADWANWVEPVLIKADGSKIKLTELKPKLVETGWGELGMNKNAAGKEMKIKGQAIPFGFGVHAPARLGFDLPEGVVALEAQAGLDDGGTSQKVGGTVAFKVYAQNTGPVAAAAAAPAPTSGPRYGLEAAKAAIAGFKTPDGLKVSLVAAEPMVINPTNIEVDPRGRIWAAECVNYRNWMEQRPEGDRVVILEDTDGDGLADKEKTFFQSKEMTNPLGLCVLPQAKGTKVIVSAAPNVWLLTDKDGDDVAEDAKIIFKVGGTWNYDHQIHAFVFGPDGKFYFNSGNSITELKWPDGSIVKDRAGHEITNKGKPYWQGMVYRCDIDLETGKASNVETLGHNFRNNYEVAVDSFGTMWQSDNDDDGNKGVRINYVMQYGNYGFTDELTGAGWQTKRTNIESEIPLRHWYQNDPGVVPNLLQTGAGSPTGILVNEGTALGAQFTNQMIHCDSGPRTVRAYPVENDGAGYKATMVDILTSTDQWYRASDVAIAPDGSLVISDWYDSGVGGHNMGDREKGKMMGRIYRVSSGQKVAAPTPDVSTAAGAVAALQSPNKPTQYSAWTALQKMGAAAEPALLALWKNEDPRMRARALALLTQIKGRENEFLTAGLKDADANVRIAAIRLVILLHTTRGLDTTPLESDRPLVAALVQDKSPQVRREIALALRGAKDIAPLWVALAQQHDGKDRWYLEALGIGAAGNEDACFDAWLAAVGEKWNTPAGRDIIWRMRSAKNAGFLAKILSDKSIADTDKPRYLRAFDLLPTSDDKTKALVSLAGLGDSMGMVAGEALARLKNVDVNANPEVKAAIEKQLASAKGTPRFIQLVRDFKLAGQSPALLDAALKTPQDPLAADALKLILADQDSKPLDAALTGPQSAAVIALLGGSGDRRAIAALTGIVVSPNGGLARTDAVKALARSLTGATALVQIAKDGKLAADLKPAATAALNLVQYPALKADIAALFPAPAALGGKPLAPIAELVKMTGDLAKGKVITERLESSCVTCHRIGDKGIDFAPALTEIGSKLPKEALYDAIINPNTGLTMGFETTQLATKDGTAALGIVRSETADEIVLALPGGATNKFAKNQIAKREKLTTSLMPSGLNQALSQQDLIDMVEYLASLKKK